LIDILEKRRKEPDELREASAEVLAIVRALPARPVLERIAQNKKEPERLRDAAARAAKAIAALPRSLPPGTASVQPPPPKPAPAKPTPDRPVEIPFAGSVPQIRGLPAPEPLPFQVVGTPQAATTEDEVARVDDAWAPEPPSRPQLPPEVASL